MGQFNIQRARGTLPGRATQVRADMDVRTGGQQIAQAVSGLGGAVANLGLKWDIMEADTQLSEAMMFSGQEDNRLMLELPGLEPPEHAEAYKKSLKIQQSFTPKNKRAAFSYGQYLNKSTAQRDKNVTDATKAKLKDNMRAMGFISQQAAIQSGIFKPYFTHLEKGKLMGVYDAEEVEKYKQATIDSRERYVKLQVIQQKEQLEIEREKDRDKISKLIRAGEAADTAIESSNLEESEQFTWFERQRVDVERRAKEIPIAVNYSIKGNLEAMAYDISTGAVTMPEFNKRLTEERYDKKTIDDGVYDELFSLAERKFESYQAGAMKGREVHALGQLVDLPSEEGYKEMLMRMTSKFAKDQLTSLRKLQFDNLDQYKKALRDWLKLPKNKDANADEIYKEGRRLLTHYRKTPDQLRNPLTAGEAAVAAIKKVAAQAELAKKPVKSISDVPEPKTKREMINKLRELEAIDPALSAEYYKKYLDKFW